MPETDEEKQKRWAKSRAKSYMTPGMAHAMAMSKYQSQNKYKEQFNKTRGTGFTQVTNTPELENVRKQSIRASQNKYKSDFEKNKAKFTAVADDPETLRVKRVTNQVSKIAYEGKGTAMAESKSRKNRTAAKEDQETTKPAQSEVETEVPTSHERELEPEEMIQEELEPATNENGEEPGSYSESHDQSYSESSEQASGGHDYSNISYHDEEPESTPHENGGNDESYQEPPSQRSEEEEDGEDRGSREYRETDSEEPQLKECSEGGLDDFYANLG